MLFLVEEGTEVAVDPQFYDLCVIKQISHRLADVISDIGAGENGSSMISTTKIRDKLIEKYYISEGSPKPIFTVLNMVNGQFIKVGTVSDDETSLTGSIVFLGNSTTPPDSVTGAKIYYT